MLNISKLNRFEQSWQQIDKILDLSNLDEDSKRHFTNIGYLYLSGKNEQLESVPKEIHIKCETILKNLFSNKFECLSQIYRKKVFNEAIENEEFEQIIEHGGSFEGLNLSGIDFKNLKSNKLSGFCFRNCTFGRQYAISEVDFSYCDFSESNFSRAKYISNCNFSHSNFENTNMKHLSINKSDFSNSNFEFVSFLDNNITNSKFNNCKFKSCDFNHLTGNNTDFSNSIFVNGTFFSCDFLLCRTTNTKFNGDKFSKLQNKKILIRNITTEKRWCTGFEEKSYNNSFDILSINFGEYGDLQFITRLTGYGKLGLIPFDNYDFGNGNILQNNAIYIITNESGNTRSSIIEQIQACKGKGGNVIKIGITKNQSLNLACSRPFSIQYKANRDNLDNLVSRHRL